MQLKEVNHSGFTESNGLGEVLNMRKSKEKASGTKICWKDSGRDQDEIRFKAFN